VVDFWENDPEEFYRPRRIVLPFFIAVILMLLARSNWEEGNGSSVTVWALLCLFEVFIGVIVTKCRGSLGLLISTLHSSLVFLFLLTGSVIVFMNGGWSGNFIAFVVVLILMGVETTQNLWKFRKYHSPEKQLVGPAVNHQPKTNHKAGTFTSFSGLVGIVKDVGVTFLLICFVAVLLPQIANRKWQQVRRLFPGVTRVEAPPTSHPRINRTQIPIDSMIGAKRYLWVQDDPGIRITLYNQILNHYYQYGPTDSLLVYMQRVFDDPDVSEDQIDVPGLDWAQDQDEKP